MDEYPPMIYGWALMRIIAFICALWLAFPDIKILISKYDLSDAYRRICHDALAAAQTILVLGIKAYIMLRLSFGGAPNPAAWTAFSEMVTDLSNDLPRDPNWDPDKLHHPLQKQVPTPEYLDNGIPLAPAREMAVDIPTTAKGRGDCFIDDIIRVFLNTKESIRRHASSALLAIFVSIRPYAGEKEPIPRKEVVSIDKWKAEGVPREVQIVLGWLINTRTMILALPLDKYRAYVKEIDKILNIVRNHAGDKSQH